MDGRLFRIVGIGGDRVWNLGIAKSAISSTTSPSFPLSIDVRLKPPPWQKAETLAKARWF
jgi:hypothetical protein